MMTGTIKTLNVSFRALVLFTVLTGGVYPLVVTGISKIIFPHEANGSLLTRGERIVGSELIGQKFTGPIYFHSRPSAADYATLPSGASNLSPTSLALKNIVEERRAALGGAAPFDLLTASASGLDPHVSPAAAKFQIPRIVEARSLGIAGIAELTALVDQITEGPQLGFLGKERVNVLVLNLVLGKKLSENAP